MRTWIFADPKLKKYEIGGLAEGGVAGQLDRRHDGPIVPLPLKSNCITGS